MAYFAADCSSNLNLFLGDFLGIFDSVQSKTEGTAFGFNNFSPVGVHL